MLASLFLVYWKLIRFQETPDNTPYSHFLLGISILFLTLVMTLQWRFSEFEFSDDLLLTTLIAVSLVFSFVLYTYAILYFRGLGSRWVQTVTCLCTSHAIIHLLASPLFLVDPYLEHTSLKNPLVLFIAVIYLFVTLGLSVWQFVITAYIYKSAMDSTNVQSVLAAFGLIAVNVLTVSFWR
ncbi:hypothetical protein [Legionella bononiensis]|uniref:Uncharacterized protein n=1 Tax=Legionella bononiensis TaxID=2793102 RepID=A0ABS1WCP2_9GAMM|nr:hypothetical protein [Legionella bononiensis]MBL7478992.1 hypothetical protein [Legionella bononiensis]MBL7527125.1 hypothetical protein [Legionella bononiensis]MBL7562094.1 hypothetical protein [Legionella bononiensis]